MQSIKASPKRLPRQAMSPNLAATIQPAKDAAKRLKRRSGRFEIYGLLEQIYRIYREWKRLGVANRSARMLADEISTTRRKGMSAIRVLVEATLPDADFKQKSRWVRALEYVYSEDVPAREFERFIRAHRGLAGCARLAAQANRKRRLPGGDWYD